MATKDISVCSFLTTADVSSQSFGLGGLRVQYPSPFNLSSDIPREKVTDHCKVDGKQKHDRSDGVSLLPHGGAESLARCCYNNNINNNSTDVTAFLLLVVWFGPKCTLVDQKMSLLPGTKDITPGDPMADYVNALKAWDRDAHDQYFVRFQDDPGPSQVMLAEEFYATDVDGVPGSCCLQSHVREGIFRDADMSRDDDFQES